MAPTKTIAAVLLTAGSLCAASCGPREEPAPAAEVAGANPVLLVGFDGFEWSVALPLVRDGRLPNLRRLMERGTWGRLASFSPTKSPVLWTSAVTGMVPDKHGILDFVRRAAGDGAPRALYTSLDRRVPALWNIFSERGRRVAVVGWWNSYPAEPVDGVVVAQVNTLGADRPDEARGQIKGALFEDRAGQVYPPERSDEILAVVPQVVDELPRIVRSIFGELPEELPAPASRLWANCFWSFRADATYRRVALRLLREERFDLFAVYFGGSDVIAHRFWRYMEPELYDHPPPESELALFGDVIADYYAYLDETLGELIAAAPPNSNVLVMSDHGMVLQHRSRRFDTGARPRRLLSAGHEAAEPGVLVAAGPDIRASAAAPDAVALGGIPQLGTLLDVAPTVLALAGLPVGRDMDGRVMEELLTPEYLARFEIAWVDSHTPAGWGARAAGAGAATPGEQERLDQLRSLGYIGGTETATESGVTIHDRERAQDGLNFYCSGHAPEAFLMDMDGKVIHRWSRSFSELWPDAEVARDDENASWWRRCHLLPDRSILVIFEGLGIARLDADSNPIWKNLNGAHHDLEVLPDGSIWVLTRERRRLPRLGIDRSVLEDYAVHLDASGRESRRLSLLEAFEGSEFREVWTRSGARPGPHGDLFHTNTIEVLDGRAAERLPAFAKGNLLVSMLKLDAIAVVDPAREEVVWAHAGGFRKQHDPKLLDGGNLLLFDNRGPGGARSRVLELDPETLETAWEYRGTDTRPFFSKQLGTAERLPNGNTLITESDRGRAFEVTPSGEIVWEFHNPHRVGEGGTLVARIPELVRVLPD